MASSLVFLLMVLMVSVTSADLGTFQRFLVSFFKFVAFNVFFQVKGGKTMASSKGLFIKEYRMFQNMVKEKKLKVIKKTRELIGCHTPPLSG